MFQSAKNCTDWFAWSALFSVSLWPMISRTRSEVWGWERTCSSWLLCKLCKEEVQRCGGHMWCSGRAGVQEEGTCWSVSPQGPPGIVIIWLLDTVNEYYLEYLEWTKSYCHDWKAVGQLNERLTSPGATSRAATPCLPFASLHTTFQHHFRRYYDGG